MSEKHVCPRCGRENDPEATNCIRCGLDFSQEWATQEEQEAPSAFCYKHSKVPTNLSCGRCERPICTKCAVIGPNGVRCKECAKLHIPVRPGAVVHEVKRSVFSLMRFGPWGLWIIVTVIGSLFWMIRSCAAPDHSAPESRQESPSDE